MIHFHNTITLRDDAEVIIDFCTECKKKLIYRKCRRTGRIDNRRFAEEHKRDFLQKGEKYYDKFYGNND